MNGSQAGAEGGESPSTGGLVWAEPNQALLLAGHKPKQLLRVTEGWALREMYLPAGDRHIVELYMPGDLVALSWLRGLPERSNVIALTPFAAQSIPLAKVHRAIERSSEMQAALIRALGEELEYQQYLSMITARQPSIVRVAFHIQALFARAALAGLINKDSFSIPLSQLAFADLVGITAVHMNRVVRDLRLDGIVAFARGTVKVLDGARLAEKTSWPELKPWLDARSQLAKLLVD